MSYSPSPTPEPVRFRYDTDRDVAEGDWILCAATPGHPTGRFWIVLSARLIRHRAPIEHAHRWALLCQPIAAPTEDDPSLPDGVTDPDATLHLVIEFRRRQTRRR